MSKRQENPGKENPDVFYIESKRATHRKKEDDLFLDSYQGHNWGERLSFTVGVSYIVGIICIFEILPKELVLFSCRVWRSQGTC